MRGRRALRSGRREIAYGSVVAGVIGLTTLAVAATDDSPRRVIGTLDRCGDGYCVGNQRVEFGPDEVLASTVARQDYDGDDSRESLAEEIEGMRHLDRVMLEVAGDSDGAVLTVQGLPYTSAEVSAAPAGQELPSPSGAAGGAAPSEDGTSLESLAGILVECGSGYCLDIGGTLHALDFGPIWWLQSTTLEQRGDLDGDGTAEVLADEIAGLVGSRVEVLVERGRTGDEADVHAVNGVRYRGGVDEPPEWAGGPGQGFRRGGFLAGPPPGVPRPPDPPVEAGTEPAPKPSSGPEVTPDTDQQQPPDGGPPTHVPAGPPESLMVGGLKGGPPQGTPGGGDEDADDEEEGDQTGPPPYVGGPPQGSGETP